MPGGNLNKEIFLNTVKSDAANGTANAVSMLKRSCPELSDAHCEDILGTIIGAMNMSEADKVSLVVTAPPSFSISARTTMNVVQSMINGAERNIRVLKIAENGSCWGDCLSGKGKARMQEL